MLGKSKQRVYTCVCMHVCTDVCMHVCMYVCMCEKVDIVHDEYTQYCGFQLLAS